MEAPSWLQDLKSNLFGRSLSLWDSLMVTLAAASAFALLLRRELLLPDPYARWIWIGDLVVCGIFAIEYAWHLLRAPDKGRFVRGTWYDLVGMIPLPIALLRIFRLVRIPHVLFWGARDRKADEDPHLLAVFRRYEPVIVEELTDPLVHRALGALRNVVTRQRYLEAVGENLRARRDKVEGAVHRGLESSAVLRTVMMVPGGAAAARELEGQLVDVIVETLTDPELDQAIRESIDAALAEMQAKVAEKTAAPAP